MPNRYLAAERHINYLEKPILKSVSMSSLSKELLHEWCKLYLDKAEEIILLIYFEYSPSFSLHNKTHISFFESQASGT